MLSGITSTSRSLTPAGRDSRILIFSTALRLFESKGFDATSVQEIVEGAGLTKGAFYHYFRHKEELLLAIHDAFIDEALGTATEIVRTSPNARTAVSRLIESWMDLVHQHTSEVRIFFQEYRYLSERRYAKIRRKRDLFEQVIVRLIEDGVTNGEFHPIDHPRLLAFGLIGLCGWSYQWYRPGGPVTARDVGRMYAQVILNGLTSGRYVEEFRFDPKHPSRGSPRS